MNARQGEAYDRWLDQGSDECGGCDKDSPVEDHDWRYLGSTPDGDHLYECRNCGKELET